MTPPKDIDDNGKEIIEAEFCELADTDAAGEDGNRHAGNGAASEGGFDTPF